MTDIPKQIGPPPDEHGKLPLASPNTSLVLVSDQDLVDELNRRHDLGTLHLKFTKVRKPTHAEVDDLGCSPSAEVRDML